MSYSRTLTIAALMGGAALISAPAFAGCQTTCDSNSAHSHSGYTSSAHSHGQPLSNWQASSSYVAPSSHASSLTSGSSYSAGTTYSSTASYGSTVANCPSGTSAQADGTCLDTSGSYSSSSYSASSYSAPSSSYVSSASSDYGQLISTPTSSSTNYGSGSISQSYTLNDTTVVPFTGSTSVLGLGGNEQLIPTDCPVSVYNPGGGKVLGCYAVAKPVPVVRPAPVINYTRVVRPVIYVRYPVPTPVPYIQDVYVDNQCGGNFSRYGAGYPGRCGW